MKKLSIKKPLLRALQFATLGLFACLISCGGGGGSSENNVRPNTINGLTFIFGSASDPDAFRIDFLRYLSSAPADETGVSEEGAIIYSATANSLERNDGDLRIALPTSMDARYRYTPTGRNTALIEIISKNATYETADDDPGGVIFFSPSDIERITSFNITFDVSDFGRVEIVNVEFSGFPNEPPAPFESSALLTGSVFITASTAPPTPGYSDQPNENADQESQISPQSLADRNIRFNPDLAPDVFFSVTCVRDLFNANLESGSASIRDANLDPILGNHTYEYRRIKNTDTTSFRLVINDPENPIDNIYLLNFQTVESDISTPLSQRYTGTFEITDGPDAGVTGTFIIRDARNIGE